MIFFYIFNFTFLILRQSRQTRHFISAKKLFPLIRKLIYNKLIIKYLNANTAVPH